MTKRIARVRIHVERVIGTLQQKYTILQGPLPMDYLTSNKDQIIAPVDKIVSVRSALFNLTDSIVPFDWKPYRNALFIHKDYFVLFPETFLYCGSFLQAVHSHFALLLGDCLIFRQLRGNVLIKQAGLWHTSIGSDSGFLQSQQSPSIRLSDNDPELGSDLVK